MRTRRFGIAVAAGCLVAALPSAGTAGPPPRAVVTADLGSDCGTPAAQPVPDGTPIVVSLPPVTFTVGQISLTVWRHPLSASLGWRLTFEGFMYLPALALRAYLDGSTSSLATMVDQVVAFHEQNPDPGTNAYGWDEGTAQRRLQTENCLYLLTADERLRAGMTADVMVQLGPRYYGPPYARVHNHGIMANLRIVRAGELLDVPDWRTIGLSRMRTEAPLAFSPAGTTWEQSTAYHDFIMRLWNQAADLLTRHEPGSPVIAVIRAVTARAATVTTWMTEPDGQTVPIGDSDTQLGTTGTSTGRVFRDDAAGWLMGRWSWTDPNTSYYSVRYGPPRWAHGHEDRGAVTWSSWGTRVLVDAGRFSSDPSTIWGAWSVSPQAHNVAVLRASHFRGGRVTLIAGTVQAPAHAWRLEDDLYSLHHTRAVNIRVDTQTMLVRDSYAGAGPADQYFHLDSAWALVSLSASRHTSVFRHPSGRLLTVSTTGVIAQVVRGATRPVAGWVFPRLGVRNWAYQLRIANITRTTVTTFTLR